MKKWLLGSFFFLAILVAGSYIFIPGDIVFRNEVSIAANPQGFNRTFFDNTDWQRWWPGKKLSASREEGMNSYLFKGCRYTIVEKRINALAITVSDNSSSIATLLNIVPVSDDSVKIIWVGQTTHSVNPFRRVKTYFDSKELDENRSEILQQIRAYYSKENNIYGLHIQKALITDSLLVSTFQTSKAYPDNAFVYNLIRQLKDYIKRQKAKETGYPMLHVTTNEDGSYLTRVAIPTDRRLKSSGNISFKWMMPGGNILVTEVKGGQATIDNAFHQMTAYVGDLHITMPAIPFQSLLTNRLLEKDTGKWITKVSFPVR